VSEEPLGACPICNGQIEWSEWSKARVDESLVRENADIRMGRCRCFGKTYIQTRPGRASDAPGEDGQGATLSIENAGGVRSVCSTTQ
jgi:hypothetical protein